MRDTTRTTITIAGAAAGMVLFALCSHQGMPVGIIAAVGLIITATAITWAGPRAAGALFGVGRWSGAMLAFSLAGAAIGTAAGLWHRYGLGLPLQPDTGVHAFVIVACVIGAAEELVYRGWLLGQARAYGWPVAIIVSAVAHAAYKTALFAWPAVPVSIDLWEVLWFTTAGGLVLGALRVWSASVVPAVTAHVAFDFVVYRGLADAPWWVWG